MKVAIPILLLALAVGLPERVQAAEWWTARDGSSADRAAVLTELAEADFVLLGETHDNPHHHRAQAALLQGLLDAGRRPAVVWEMVSRDRQGAIDAWAAGPERNDPDGFAAAVGWADSGWPDWALYRPLAEIAVRAGLAMVAGDLAPARIRAVGGGGLAALGDARRAAWRLDTALPAGLRALQGEAVFLGHCRLVPRDRLAPMVDVQLARDASMAAALVSALERSGDGAVLIAGRGHVRDDAGVPVHLKRLRPDARIASVALTEGPSASGPFDWRRGYPAVERPDPCIRLRARFKSG